MQSRIERTSSSWCAVWDACAVNAVALVAARLATGSNASVCSVRTARLAAAATEPAASLFCVCVGKTDLGQIRSCVCKSRDNVRGNCKVDSGLQYPIKIAAKLTRPDWCMRK